MSTGEQRQQAGQPQVETEAQAQPAGSRHQCHATDRTLTREELIRTLTEEALKGTVTFDKDVTRTIKAGIQAIDDAVSQQLAAILHHPQFQKLEGTWRGLHYLVMNSETGTQLKLKVLNCDKKSLQKDLEKAVEFDQSQLYKKIYESEFGTPGGRALRSPDRRFRVSEPSG